MRARALDPRSGSVPPPVAAVLREGGRPLDGATRRAAEDRLGRDFGGVRVHTGPAAERAAVSVGASAFTVGSRVVFGPGQHAPRTARGRDLLLHELTHVAQQDGISGSSSVPGTAEAAERAARRNAGQEPGGPVSPGRSPVGLQRQEADEEEVRRWTRMVLGERYQLQLDPAIQADLMAMRMRQLLRPDRVRSSILGVDLSSILEAGPPPWLTAPESEPEPERPAVPRGAGPGTPRPAGAGDLLKAVLRVPAVDDALTRLAGQAERDWRSLSTGGQAAVITQTALIGGAGLAGLLSSREGRDFALNLLEDRTLPTGVPGLTFQFRLSGREQRVRFDLNVGGLLPRSWGFQ